MLTRRHAQTATTAFSPGSVWASLVIHGDAHRPAWALAISCCQNVWVSSKLRSVRPID